jgi:hypothetical protein
MFRLSAADAIAPAIQRTRIFLFRPFRLGTYLKLCLVAVLTEGGSGGNFNSSSFGNHHKSPSHAADFSYTPFVFSPLRIAEFVAMSLLVILLCFWLYYLITRLRFAFFHCLIHNVKEIRPGWRLYREPAKRFFWLNVVIGFCFLLVVALIALPFVAGFWGLFQNVGAGGHPSFAAIFALLLPLIPIILLIILAGFLVDVVLRDLMLPHYALENATAGQAWAGAWARIRAEKGPFFVYALLRLLLPIVALIGLFIVLIIPAIIFVVVVAAVEAGIHLSFSGATVGVAMAGVFLEVLVGVLAVAVGLLVCIAVGGPLSTAVRQYALLFYGGRYQVLGNILWPAPPPVEGLHVLGTA